MHKIPHRPYIAAHESTAEFSFKAILVGCLFGLIFGASTVYLALKVGLTVSASIPISVLAIAFFKKYGQSTILENNIVQTIGSAGESIAAGVAFTLPAFLFLAHGKDYFHYFQIFILALVGGILGVLFMIPLRKNLIVDEHGFLPFPEGTACADVLVAGEKGGNLAKQVYYGIGIAFLYKVFMSIFGLWKEIPHYIFSKKSNLPNGNLAADISPELLGVGYIIGPRFAGVMVAGGILSAMVITPLITYFGEFITQVVAPGTKLISRMTPREIWSQYIRYIGIGAVTFAGVVTMLKTLPTIVQTFKQTFKEFKFDQSKVKQPSRLERDLPLSYTILGALALVILMAILPQIPVNAISALIVVVAGFFFVVVSSRIVGLIGTSSNPVSGMTIATLIGTCLIFIVQGMTNDIYQPIALSVGAIVAIAAANAGATSQDLKTGFLVGATPLKQQLGMIIGVVVSSVAIGATLILLENALGFGEVTTEHAHPLPAPQSTLMATIIKGMFDQSLPWGLVMIGMGIAAVVELCGVNSLSFAVGSYLPLSTTAPIFLGGLVKWAVRRKKKIKAEDSDLESGSLFSSGLIAGGSLTGILVAIFLGTAIGSRLDGKDITLMDKINTGIGEHLQYGDLIAIGVFAVLCALLYFFATKKEETLQPPSSKE